MMTKPTPFEKRVKRQVTAREHTFFIIISPGLEQTCLSELKALFPEKELAILDGGIEFNGTVKDCYLANLHLRTASRILMRLDDFNATGFGKLEKKLGEFPWDLYLSADRPHEVSVNSKKSRLIHSDAIAERVSKSIYTKLDQTPAELKGLSQKIHIRVFNDRFYLSLDSSGDLLYKRGLKTGGGKAPVRETIASHALLMTGYTGECPLFDPMSGSGSFSIEAAMIACNIPPGWYRSFMFQQWPCFRDGAWKDIRREAEKKINLTTETEIYASDIDSEAIDSLTKTVAKTAFKSLIHITQKDFFKLQPEGVSGNKGIVIINPPYGLRLDKSKDNALLFNQIFHHFQTEFKGWTIAVLSPFSSLKGKRSLNIKKYPISHGGLKLFLVIGKS